MAVMGQRNGESAMVDISRAAAEIVDEMHLVRTIDEIPREHRPRTATQQNGSSVKATLSIDMVRNASIDPDGSYQPLLYSGGAPLVIDEPCIILRQHPAAGDRDE